MLFLHWGDYQLKSHFNRRIMSLRTKQRKEITDDLVDIVNSCRLHILLTKNGKTQQHYLR